MDNRALFKLLNQEYKGKPLQFIPAYSSLKMPPFPFCTFQTKSAERNLIKIDKKEVLGKKIIKKASVYTLEKLTIKCYNKTEFESYELRKEIMDLINFKISDNIRSLGYGIINLETFNVNHEKTETGYIYCYMFDLDIDYNHEIKKEINILEEVQIVGDIEEKILIGG